MKIYRFLSAAAALCLSLFVAGAQNGQQQTSEQKEKQLMEFIDKEVQRLSTLLELEYWQEFYVDSTLTHDYHAMIEEQEKMQEAKVENQDLYVAVRTKWMDQIGDSFKRFFTEEQWNKYITSDTNGRRTKDAREKKLEKKKEKRKKNKD